MAFSPADICVPRSWCFQNYLIGALSLLSVVCVLVVLWRNCRRRQKKATELSTTVGRLLEHLTITLFILDLLYHAPDLLFPMDTDAPPLWFMMKVPFKDRNVGHSLIFQFTREGMGMLSVFWHSQIAYSLCSSILGERSAPRLMGMQLWNQVLIMIVVTGIRYLLYYQGGEAGVIAAVLMYDVLVVPVCLTTMLYYYSVAVVRLHQGNKARITSAPSSEQTATSQPPPRRPLIPWAAILRRLRFAMPPPDEAIEGAVAFSSSEDQQQGVGWNQSSDAEDGSSGSANVETGVGAVNVGAGVGDTKYASRVQGPLQIQGSRSIQRREIRRHRSIIRRLLHISLAVALTWLLGTIIDLVCWLAWLIADRPVSGSILPSWLFIAGIVTLRLVGLIDAVVLGGLCDIGPSRKKKRTRYHGHLPVVVGDTMSHAEAAHPHRQRSEASPVYRHRASSMSADGGMYSCVSSSHYRSSLDYSYAEDSTASQKSTSRAYVEARALAMQSLSRSASVSNVSRSISFSFMDPYSSATSVSKDHTSALRNVSPGRQTVRVFATTWNLGCVSGGELRSELPRMLASWIPLGYDLYVIGVQECLCLKDLKALVHQHLGE